MGTMKGPQPRSGKEPQTRTTNTTQSRTTTTTSRNVPTTKTTVQAARLKPSINCNLNQQKLVKNISDLNNNDTNVKENTTIIDTIEKFSTFTISEHKPDVALLQKEIENLSLSNEGKLKTNETIENNRTSVTSHCSPKEKCNVNGSVSSDEDEETKAEVQISQKSSQDESDKLCDKNTSCSDQDKSNVVVQQKTTSDSEEKAEGSHDLVSRSPDKTPRHKEDLRHAPYPSLSLSGGSIYVVEQPQQIVPGSSQQPKFNIVHDESPQGSPPPLLVVTESVSSGNHWTAEEQDLLDRARDPNFKKFVRETLDKLSPEETINDTITDNDDISNGLLQLLQDSPGRNQSPVLSSENTILCPSSVEFNQASPTPSLEFYQSSPVSSPGNTNNHTASPSNYWTNQSPIGSPQQVVPSFGGSPLQIESNWRNPTSIRSTSSSSPSYSSYVSSPSASADEWSGSNLSDESSFLNDLYLSPSPQRADFELPGTLEVENLNQIPDTVTNTLPHVYEANNTTQVQEQSANATLLQNNTSNQSWSSDIIPESSLLQQIQHTNIIQSSSVVPQAPNSENLGNQRFVVQSHQPIQQPFIQIPPQHQTRYIFIQVPKQNIPTRGPRIILPGPPVPRTVPWSAKDRLKRKLVDDSKKQRALARVAAYSNEDLVKRKRDGDTELMILVCERSDDLLYKVYALVERLKKIPGALGARNERGETALYNASLCHPEEPLIARYLAEMLLDEGVDITEQKYEDGNSLAHCVSSRGDSHSDVLAELLSLRDKDGTQLFNLSRPNDHSGDS